MNIVIKPFAALTAAEVYEILRVRMAVFIVEQQCPYQDIDGTDQAALHLFSTEQGTITAYLRVYPHDGQPGTVHLGRVLTTVRGSGLGAQILQAGIAAAREKLGAHRIVIEAQTYAKGFYTRAGFVQTSGEFLEDGIPHMQMALELE